MPDTNHPPYEANALLYPRHLNRWLDINAQGGALKKAETYIALPSFTVADSWNGYSDIVASFNIEAPNNISLKNYIVPSAPNYVLCVSYRVGPTVTRFLLWDASGSNLNQIITPYSGQVLLKNVRFEVWNTSQGAVSNGAAIQFITSKLQPVDYMYGSDGALVSADAENDLFAYASSYIPQTIPADTTLVNQYRVSNASVVAGYWYGLTTNNPYWLTFENTQTVANDATINNLPSVLIPANMDYYRGILAATTTAYAVFMVVKFNSLTAGDYVFGFGHNYGVADLPVLVGVGGILTLNGNNIEGPLLITDKWYVLMLYYNVDAGNTAGYITPLDNPVDVVFTQHTYGAQPAMTQMSIGDSNAPSPTLTCPMYIAEIDIYQPTVAEPLTATKRQAILNFLKSVYVTGSYTLPMTFPAASVSTTN